jgi:hypothetical protein
MVKKREFIKNDSLQWFIESIVQKLVQSNKLLFPPKLVLIQNRPDVNALSAADGTLIVYIGLISEMKNESQLAFVLAHEIAHLELQHVRAKITESIERGHLRSEMKNLAELASDKASVVNLKNLKQIWYSQGSNSRLRERQADSLAFEMMDKAGYAVEESISALTLLDQSKVLKLDLEFMTQLDLPTYPLKDEWFTKRPAILSKLREDMVFEKDSVVSHPDIDLRKQILNTRMKYWSGFENIQEDHFVREMILLASFQQIESALVKEKYDLCLYLALRLRYQIPKNAYLTSIVAKVFSELFERKSYAYDFALALPDLTIGYNEELKMVNEFLHNLERTELGDIAYFFLSADENFDLRYQEHYFLLWKICSMTKRGEQRNKVKEKYEGQFEEKAYKGKMDSYTEYKSKF